MNRQWATDIADKYESGEWGWTKLAAAREVDFKMCFCLTGAIQTYYGVKWVNCPCGCGMYSSNEEPIDWEHIDAATDDFADKMFGGRFMSAIIGFNDDDNTTLQDVIAKLREYANGV